MLSVPVVVTAQGAEELLRYNAQDLTAIGELTPTVIIAGSRQNGGGTIAIRGISSSPNQTGFEQAVSVAIDGIQTSNGRIAQLGFFDMQQVEVLKGPQALFFGKNNTAGVISISSADPTDELEVKLRAAYEFVGDEITTDASISGPLGDAVGGRIAVRYRHLDGWLRNTAQPIANPFYNPATLPAELATLPGTRDPRPGDEELMGRLTLAYDPGSSFTARLKVFGAHATDGGFGVASQNIGPCSGPSPRMFGVADPNAECRVDNRTTLGEAPPIVASSFTNFNSNGRNYGKLDAVIASLDLRYTVGAITIDSLTGYNYVRYETLSGGDQTSYSQLILGEDQKQKEYSEQVRVTSDFDGPFNFTAGVFAQKVDVDAEINFKISDASYDPVSGQWALSDKFSLQTGKTLSLFGQVRLNPAPEWEIAGGVRWTRETKKARQFAKFGQGIFNVLGTTFPGSDEIGVLKGRYRDSNLSPEVTVSWHPVPDATVFAAYRTGFKAGGFGLTSPLTIFSAIDAFDFGSERARGFEIGAKGLFADRRLRLSGAIFRYNFTDLQVSTYNPLTVSYAINNAGKVRQTGAELDANMRVSDNVSLHGAVSWVRNRFSDYVGPCYAYAFAAGTDRATAVPPPNCSFVSATSLTLQQDYGGRAPARSPEWSGNMGFVAETPLAGFRAELTGDAYFSSAYYAADTLIEASRQPSYWRFNASFSLATEDDRWKVSLIGKNLTNKYVLLFAQDRTGGASVPNAIGEQRGAVSRGRQISLQLAARF